MIFHLNFISFAFLFLFRAIPIFGNNDTIIVNGTQFFFTKGEEKNEFDRFDKFVKMYRIENGKPKYLLKHYTYRSSADCNNSFEDIGVYSVHNDSLFFRTEFKQKNGIDPIPTERKQIYIVDASGKLHLLYDRELYNWDGKWIDSDYKND
ncbi:MAG: hypothetical protein ACJ77K_18850 [Bacteroidia bacterium]